MIKWFKKQSKELKQKISIRVVVISLAVIVFAVSGTVLWAAWNESISGQMTTMDNVGIGTDNPRGKLHINNGGLVVQDTNAGDGNWGGAIYISEDSTLSGCTYGDIMWNKTNNYLAIGHGGGYGETIIIKEGSVNLKRSGHSASLGLNAQGDTYRMEVPDNNSLTIGHQSYKHRFVINNNGYVGIGTTTPSCKLDISGTTTSSNYACSASDVRYKKDISTFQNSLEKVLGLRGVNYFWRTDEYKEKNFSKDKQIGLIAQEVEKVIPELVLTNKDGYKTMIYERLTAVLVEAVKELNAKSDAKISALEKENAELKQRLAKLDTVTDRLAKIERELEGKKLAQK